MTNINNNETMNIMSKVYADTNSASHIAFAKPMQGTWYYFIAPMTAANVRNIVSTVEASDEGAKMRFRPSNGAFYRAANAASVEVMPLASVEYVDSEVKAMTIETGSRVNRGNVIERLINNAVSSDKWVYNPLQRAYYDIPDIVADDGRWIQVKAYGASVTERDLHSAVEALRAR